MFFVLRVFVYFFQDFYTLHTRTTSLLAHGRSSTRITQKCPACRKKHHVWRLLPLEPFIEKPQPSDLQRTDSGPGAEFYCEKQSLLRPRFQTGSNNGTVSGIAKDYLSV